MDTVIIHTKNLMETTEQKHVLIVMEQEEVIDKFDSVRVLKNWAISLI